MINSYSLPNTWHVHMSICSISTPPPTPEIQKTQVNSKDHFWYEVLFAVIWVTDDFVVLCSFFVPMVKIFKSSYATKATMTKLISIYWLLIWWCDIRNAQKHTEIITLSCRDEPNNEKYCNKVKCIKIHVFSEDNMFSVISVCSMSTAVPLIQSSD